MGVLNGGEGGEGGNEEGKFTPVIKSGESCHLIKIGLMALLFLLE